ncbi:MAG: hypothetical protein Q7L55_09425 [Actinomycetota bacterium]|nr:hypothetical protein [Actinomycetota bacterium]
MQLTARHGKVQGHRRDRVVARLLRDVAEERDLGDVTALADPMAM